MFGPAKTAVTIDFNVVEEPRPGLCLSEAQDKWLAAGSTNRVIDDGGRGDPCLLVAASRSRQVLYEIVPELCPPGFTIDDAIRHMRAAGFNVIGRGPDSSAGHLTITVTEELLNG